MIRQPYYRMDDAGNVVSTLFLSAGEVMEQTGSGPLASPVPNQQPDPGPPRPAIIPAPPPPPPNPDPGRYRYVPGTNSYEFDLGMAKATTWARLKATRDTLLVAAFDWQGHLFDGDERSQVRIAAAVQLATLAMSSGITYSVSWTLADNSTLTLDGPSMIAVGLAMGAHYQAIFSRGQALRSQIQAATTASELDQLSW